MTLLTDSSAWLRALALAWAMSGTNKALIRRPTMPMNQLLKLPSQTSGRMRTSGQRLAKTIIGSTRAGWLGRTIVLPEDSATSVRT
jgi:hypothetical protein